MNFFFQLQRRNRQASLLPRVARVAGSATVLGCVRRWQVSGFLLNDDTLCFRSSLNYPHVEDVWSFLTAPRIDYTFRRESDATFLTAGLARIHP